MHITADQLAVRRLQAAGVGCAAVCCYAAAAKSDKQQNTIRTAYMQNNLDAWLAINNRNRERGEKIALAPYAMV